MTMSYDEIAALLKSNAETLEEIGSTLKKLNDEPNVAVPAEAKKDITEQATPDPTIRRRYITPDERNTLFDTLRTKSDNQLAALFTAQARERGTGVPLDLWLNTAGFAAQNAFQDIHGQLNPDVAKALDTVGAAALIRQDLEPLLYEVFIRIFPAYDRMRKEPANGLTHAWNQITAYGDAKFMAELGTVSDDTSTYVRKTTNVAILATRRGISLKSQFSVMAGGMNYNPEQIELQGGLRSIAHRMQTTIFEGNASVTGGTADNELGLYDANAFTGLRQLLNTADAVNIDPATAPTTTGNFRVKMDAAVLPVIQSGGRPSIAWSHPSEKITFNQQQDPNFRILAGEEQTTLGVGVVADRINTVAGPVPWAVVPGDSISDYTASTYSGNTVRDIYVLDEESITLPYLGTAGPTVLEIPIGISGQLTHMYIIFLMNGLAVKVLPWNNKIRVKVA
jgi:hypothetical protein